MDQLLTSEFGSLDDVILTPWLHPLPNRFSNSHAAVRNAQEHPKFRSSDSGTEPESSIHLSSTNTDAEASDGPESVSAGLSGFPIPTIRPRKGHKKSRAGCFSCKSRKIKCQENRPSCHNCIRRGVTCTYPVSKVTLIDRSIAKYVTRSQSPVPLINMQATPTVFTMNDLRLFHHYLQEAYPHLPISNDKTWVTEVPLIAHQNEYLMYGLLGLAASHLAFLTGDNLNTTAMQYRLKAIKGFHTAISKKFQTRNDGDAALGCAYLLTFQSTYMCDGFEDFFQFVRGCHLLSEQIRVEKLPTGFSLEGRDHFAQMEPWLHNLPRINPELLDGATTSLNAMRHLLSGPCHFLFYKMLVDCIEGANTSPLLSYCNYIAIYRHVSAMDTATFQNLTDSQNTVSRLLIAHFAAIQMVLSPIINRGWSHRKIQASAHSSFRWIFNISEKLPPNLKEYCHWPKFVANIVEEESIEKQALGSRFSVL